MPQSLLTGQLKEKPTYRVRWCSFVHAVGARKLSTVSLGVNRVSYLDVNRNYSPRKQHPLKKRKLRDDSVCIGLLEILRFFVAESSTKK